MKNFCSILHEYYPCDTRVRKECETLKAQGYAVTVICSRSEVETDCEEVNNVRVYYLKMNKNRSSKLRYIFEYLIFFVFAFIKLNLLDFKHKFDIIHVNSLPDFLVFTTIIQKVRGAKIILDMHEIMPEFFMSKYHKREKSAIIKLLKIVEKMSLKYADAVITVDEPIKQIFNQRAIPDKNITVIMNTIDETILTNNSRTDNHDFNLVYHGILTEMYDLDIAIRALSELYKKNKEFKFYIFGQGPLKEDLRILINKLGLHKNILLMGSLPYQEMLERLASMTVGILPMRKDVFLDLSFSNKLGEYVYLKIPVISSNLSTTQYYFSENEITYFSAGDPIDLKDKICYAYNNSHIMKSRAENAFQKYQTIKWSVMAKRYSNLVNSLITPGVAYGQDKELAQQWSKSAIH